MKSHIEDTEHSGKNPTPNPENLVSIKLNIDLQVTSKTFSQLKYLSDYEHVELGAILSRLLHDCIWHMDDKHMDVDMFISHLLRIYVQLKRYDPAVLDGETNVNDPSVNSASISLFSP